MAYVSTPSFSSALAILFPFESAIAGRLTETVKISITNNSTTEPTEPNRTFENI